MVRARHVVMVLCAVLLTLVQAPTRAGPAVVTPSVLSTKHFTLANGMTVLVLEDHTRPFVNLQLSLDAGAADDPPHLPGANAMLTQLFEHASTRHVRAEDRFSLIESFGVHPWKANFFSGDDRSGLQALVPSHALPLALFLESDRLGYFSDGIDAARVLAARNKLRETITLEHQNSFDFAMTLAEAEMFGDRHAYGKRWAAADLERISATTLRVRARELYAPNRAILTLAGDVTLASAKQLVTRYFGTLARGTDATTRPRETPKQASRFELSSPDKEPGVLYAWRTSPFLTDADYALDGLARLLRRRLIDRLITPDIAQRIWVQQQSHALASTFMVMGVPATGHDVDEIVKSIDSELDSLRNAPASDPELTSARDWLCLGIVNDNADLSGRAGLATGFWYRNRELNGYAKYLERYRGLTSEMVQKIARAELSSRPHVVAIRRRGSVEKDFPTRQLAPLPKQGGDARGVPREEDIRLVPPDVKIPAPFQPPSVEDIRLSNGVRALLRENHDFPRVSVRMSIDLGKKATLPVAWLSSRLLIDATLPSGKTLRQSLLDKGSVLTSESNLRTVHLSVTSLPEHFAAVSKLLVDAVMHGKARANDLERLKGTYTPLAQSSLRNRVHAWADELLFPDKSDFKFPYAKVDSDWKSAKLADVDRLRAKLAGAQITFALDGDLRPENARRALDSATRELGTQKWPRSGKIQLNTGLFLVDDPKAESVALRLTAAMPNWSDADASSAAALRWFFGTNPGLSLNLTDRFREFGVQQYGDIRSNVVMFPRFSFFFLDVEAPPSEIHKVLRGVLSHLEQLREGRIPAAAVAQAKREWQTSLRDGLSDSSDVLRWLTTIAVHEENANLMTATYRRSQLFGHEELVKVAKERLVLEKLGIVMLGNVGAIRPELEKLGIPIDYRTAPGS